MANIAGIDSSQPLLMVFCTVLSTNYNWITVLISFFIPMCGMALWKQDALFKEKGLETSLKSNTMKNVCVREREREN